MPTCHDRQVYSTGVLNEEFNLHCNQDEERVRILNILKLGHELRDGEKTTKQKYYWKQDDARNIKVIHAQLFLICQHAIIHCFRYTYFSTAINCSLRSGMITASFRSCFLSGRIFTCSRDKLHNSQQYHSANYDEFFHLFLLQVKIPPENT